MKFQRQIRTLTELVSSDNLLSSMSRIRKLFFDEPSMYYFASVLSGKSTYSGNSRYHVYPGVATQGGAGLSFSNPSIAVLKCLSESIERFTCLTYDISRVMQFNYSGQEKHILNPELYGKGKAEKIRGWVEGADAITGSVVFVPAQLAFISSHHRGEPDLVPRVSTGTASGFDRERCLLRGIYEVIERDSFMTFYYNRISIPKIQNDSIDDAYIRQLIAQCTRYRIEVHIFDMTNDLEIPTFLCILADRTGKGPAISAGMKSSAKVGAAIAGCIEEAFIGRINMRFEVDIKGNRGFDIAINSIRTHIDRGLYWYPVNRLEEVCWLLEQKSVKQTRRDLRTGNKNELNQILSLFRKKGLSLYRCDLTLPPYRGIGFHTVKAIAPQLQPMHIDEQSRMFLTGRMETVSKFFNVGRSVTNTSPHFF